MNSCSDSNEELELQSESINLEENQEFKKSHKGITQKVIFTLEDFERHANDESSVVSKLSNKAKRDFINSMEFRENGLIVTSKYFIIERELTERENEEFWLLFGMAKGLYEDHKGYKCVSPHNCKLDSNYICMTGC